MGSVIVASVSLASAREISARNASDGSVFCCKRYACTAQYAPFICMDNRTAQYVVSRTANEDVGQRQRCQFVSPRFRASSSQSLSTESVRCSARVGCTPSYGTVARIYARLSSCSPDRRSRLGRFAAAYSIAVCALFAATLCPDPRARVARVDMRFETADIRDVFGATLPRTPSRCNLLIIALRDSNTFCSRNFFEICPAVSPAAQRALI